ncbi:hypothetical protein [[Clostridium] dakarense]|uniref:hypothetical protein n=1 Tax=Faecalimicrobium dakarense TaxID=1301100 RepID=UPI0004AD4A2C|nr:hypothetical protein [[Clostridium] dakarense]
MGGKSSCILQNALQFVDEPGYACAIIRLSYADFNNIIASIGAIACESILISNNRKKYQEINEERQRIEDLKAMVVEMPNFIGGPVEKIGEFFRK